MTGCPECGGKLGVKATKCRCGWVMPGAPRDAGVPAAPKIACCFQGCPNAANVRVWTKTGWANVCARVNASELGEFHYEKLEQVPRATSSHYLREILAARRRRAGNVRLPAYEREPGQDDEENAAQPETPSGGQEQTKAELDIPPFPESTPADAAFVETDPLVLEAWRMIAEAEAEARA